MASYTIEYSFEVNQTDVTPTTFTVEVLSGKDGVDGTNGTNGADGADGTNGVGVPVGGTADQVLTKIDATDYNTEWRDASGGGGKDVIATLGIFEIGMDSDRIYYLNVDAGQFSNYDLIRGQSAIDWDFSDLAIASRDQAVAGVPLPKAATTIYVKGQNFVEANIAGTVSVILFKYDVNTYDILENPIPKIQVIGQQDFINPSFLFVNKIDFSAIGTFNEFDRVGIIIYSPNANSYGVNINLTLMIE